MKRLAQAIARRFGYRIVRIDGTIQTKHAEGLDPFFGLLKQRGFAPRHIVDVGANRGIWTREAIKFFPEAQYTLVEPQDYLKMYVKDLMERGYKIEWINAGAGDESGSLPLSVGARDDSSSFVPGREAEGASCVTVPVMTLNEIVGSRKAAIPELVKIDAEGFDLRVIRGASELLGKTDVFLVESVVCAPNYENTVDKVVGTMAEAGYRVVDITDLNRSPKYGVLWLCELAFLRNASSLLDGVKTYE